MNVKVFDSLRRLIDYLDAIVEHLMKTRLVHVL